jgi:hypothetical protein
VEYRIGGNSYNSLVVLAQLRAQAGHAAATHPLELVASLARDWRVPFAIPGVSATRCVVRGGGEHAQPQSFILACPGSRTVLSDNRLPDLTAAEWEGGLLRHLEGEVFTAAPSAGRRAWLHFEGRNLAHLPAMLEGARGLRARLPQGPQRLTLSLEVERPDRVELMRLLPQVDVCCFSALMAAHHGFGGREGEFLRWTLGRVAEEAPPTPRPHR